MGRDADEVSGLPIEVSLNGFQQSGEDGPPIPAEGGHPFRVKPATSL
jgi:hypothetical protein